METCPAFTLFIRSLLNSSQTFTTGFLPALIQRHRWIKLSLLQCNTSGLPPTKIVGDY